MIRIYELLGYSVAGLVGAGALGARGLWPGAVILGALGLVALAVLMGAIARLSADAHAMRGED